MCIIYVGDKHLLTLQSIFPGFPVNRKSGLEPDTVSAGLLGFVEFFIGFLKKIFFGFDGF